MRLLRWDFELYRFDLVRYVNQLDSKKVVLLETGINRAFYGKCVNITRVCDAQLCLAAWERVSCFVTSKRLSLRCVLWWC